MKLFEQFRVQLHVVAVLSVFIGVGGCASSSQDVQPSYVSPIIYNDYDCSQLAAEAQRVSGAASKAAGAQDEKRTSDAVATGVAVVVFWPAAFFVGGDGQTAAELAKLKGQMDAIEQTSIRKKCGIQFQKMEPEAT